LLAGEHQIAISRLRSQKDLQSGPAIVRRSFWVLRKARDCRSLIACIDIIGLPSGVAPDIPSSTATSQSTLTNTSPQYNACSCSCYVSSALFILQISFSNGSFEAYTNINCTHRLASSYTYNPTHIHTNRNDVDGQHTVAGLLQHTRCNQRYLQREGRMDSS